MDWAGVTSDGKKAPIIFVEEGVKIDQAVTWIFFQRRSSHGHKESILRLFYCSNKMELHPIPASWFKASALICLQTFGPKTCGLPPPQI
ncbi:Uncharacterized protein FKW44_018813 [Caligus rogercresseyi]|uniref:Uncharacterized protein n=1 Tax=Caligus rogercresseyi TaxID=217165 RepID=A0A7T8JWZ4_CALRO|nr:Uncharacterized protein FKW44_018813 [Caligus rogercresseyi]